MVRIVVNTDDYLAHRTLFGLLSGVGAVTCLAVGQKVMDSGLNYRGIYYAPMPAGVFTARETSLISQMASICAELATWSPDDLLQDRLARIIDLHVPFGNDVQTSVAGFLAGLPPNLTLKELREYMATMSADKRARILSDANERAGTPAAEAIESKVRIITMHGAKGMSARALFIPGLEEQVFPGPRRQPFPGLIDEAARLLYVSITRARAACFLSFARRRTVHGQSRPQAPSRFNHATGGAFSGQTGRLDDVGIQRIVADCANL